MEIVENVVVARKVSRCRIFHEVGHNCRTCPDNLGLANGNSIRQQEAEGKIPLLFIIISAANIF